MNPEKQLALEVLSLTGESAPYRAEREYAVAVLTRIMMQEVETKEVRQ